MATRPTTLSIPTPTEDFPRQLLGYKTLRGGREVAVVVDVDGVMTISRIFTSGRGKKRTSTATLSITDARGDSVKRKVPVTPKEAMDAIRSAKKRVGKKGPVTRKGTWTGKMTVHEDLRIDLVLTRKVASYGVLTITRLRNQIGWSWHFERKERWFSDEAAGTDHTGYPNLGEAVKAAYAGMLGYIGAACGVRDTTRRQARDPAYASKYPLRPGRPRKDRVVLFLEKSRRPTSPKTKAAQKKMTASVITDAVEARTELEKPQPAAAVNLTLAEVESELDGLLANWRAYTVRDTSKDFTRAELALLPSLADAVRSYTGNRYQPADKTIALSAFDKDIRSRIATSYKGAGRKAQIRKAVLADWEAVLQLLKSPPAIFHRAQRLLQFAAASIASKKCVGAEKQEATSLLEMAKAHLERATLKMQGGGLTRASITELKRGLETVALAAARAGKRCGLGQTALFTASQINPSSLHDVPTGLEDTPLTTRRPKGNTPSPSVTLELPKGTGIKKADLVKYARGALSRQLKKHSPTVEITGGGRGNYTLEAKISNHVPSSVTRAALAAAEQALDGWIAKKTGATNAKTTAKTTKPTAKKTPAKRSTKKPPAKTAQTTAEKDAAIANLFKGAIGELISELKTQQAAA